MTPEVECLWPLAAELGEGPVWSAGEGAVWFVDIKGRRVHRFDPATREGRSWDAPSNPGFLAPVSGGRWLAGLKSGLHLFDPSEGGFEMLSVVEPRAPDNRLNDGCVDPMGRLWFGSMHDPETDATGALYRLERDGTLKPHDTGYVITNGPAFSPDGRTVYHTDTLERVIYAFDLDEDGRLSGKRVFARIDRGYPDGPAVDSEGCIWSALYGGWGLNRYAPDGALIEHVPLPVANVTKAAFGGPDLRTVYVTTAWKGLSAAEREAQPLAGGLFAFRTEIPGLPQREARLDL